MFKDHFKITKLATRAPLGGISQEASVSVFESLPAGVYELQPRYFIDEQEILKGQTISLRHIEFRCCECDRVVKKLFSGVCYPCLQSRASADLCITNPHRCHFLAGTCREPEWAVGFCYQPHYLYLAYTDKFKIGLTRENQVPQRWIDQGATAATLVAKVGSRHQAGVFEQALGSLIADKTHWQRMLKNKNAAPDFTELALLKKQILSFLSERYAALTPPTPDGLDISLQPTFYDADVFFKIEYPLDDLPEKIKALSIDEAPLEGTITGIKGQYLIFENGVFNARRHEGSVVELTLH